MSKIEVVHIRKQGEHSNYIKSKEEADKEFNNDVLDGCVLIIAFIVELILGFVSLAMDDGIDVCLIACISAAVSLIAICFSRTAFWIVQIITYITILLPFLL